MGKKRSQTHTSSTNRKQKTNYNSCIIFNRWVNVTFTNVFQGTISWALPPMNEGKKNCLSSGFHLMYSSIISLIWKPLKSLLNTSSCPISKVQVDKLALLEEKKMVWLIDYWSIHKSKEFMDWIKFKFPKACVISIPANYTCVLQPVDVILQCTFKHVFKR